MPAHINEDGEFQSDKYPTCPPGKVPLSVKDPTAQDLLWEYAQRRRAVDAEFSFDLETVLRAAGYAPPPLHVYTNHEEWYVAANDADLEALMREMLGDDWNEYGPWEQLPDDEALTLTADENGDVADEDTKDPKPLTRPAGDWAKQNGRGLLGTTYL